LEVALLDVDDLVSQDFSDALLRPEGVFSHSLGNQIDGLVDSPHGGDVDCLFPDHSSRSDSGRVLSGSGLHDGVHQHFKRVLAGQQVDNLEGVSHDSDSLDFLAGIATVELERAYQSLNDGAEGFSEFSALISAGSVGDEDLGFGGFGGDVVDEAGVFDLGVGRDTLMSS
jgi:hypothetical protein